jgi:hypothetical protein
MLVKCHVGEMTCWLNTIFAKCYVGLSHILRNVMLAKCDVEMSHYKISKGHISQLFVGK